MTLWRSKSYRRGREEVTPTAVPVGPYTNSLRDAGNFSGEPAQQPLITFEFLKVTPGEGIGTSQHEAPPFLPI